MTRAAATAARSAARCAAASRPTARATAPAITVAIRTPASPPTSRTDAWPRAERSRRRTGAGTRPARSRGRLIVRPPAGALPDGAWRVDAGARERAAWAAGERAHGHERHRREAARDQPRERALGVRRDDHQQVLLGERFVERDASRRRDREHGRRGDQRHAASGGRELGVARVQPDPREASAHLGLEAVRLEPAADAAGGRAAAAADAGRAGPDDRDRRRLRAALAPQRQRERRRDRLDLARPTEHGRGRDDRVGHEIAAGGARIDVRGRDDHRSALRRPRVGADVAGEPVGDVRERDEPPERAHDGPA